MKNEQDGHLNVLILDIETSSIEAHVWGLWDQNISLDMVKTPWSILSYSAKWLHQKKVMYNDTGGRGRKKVRDDKHLLLELHELLDKADIVVGQNHRSFDLKRINSRMVLCRHRPIFTS